MKNLPFTPSLVALLLIGAAGIVRGQVTNIPVPNYHFSAQGQVITNNPDGLTDYTVDDGNGTEYYGVLTDTTTSGVTVSDPKIPGSTTTGFVNGYTNYIVTLTTGVLGATTANPTGVIIAPDMTYSFTLDVGNPTNHPGTTPSTNDYLNPGEVTFGLLASEFGITAPTAAFTVVPAGTVPESTLFQTANFETFTFTYTTTDADPDLGASLIAEITVQNTGGPSTQTYVDNLQVSEIPVPEPGTWALLAAGLVALLAVRRSGREA